MGVGGIGLPACSCRIQDPEEAMSQLGGVLGSSGITSRKTSGAIAGLSYLDGGGQRFSVAGNISNPEKKTAT